MISGGGRLAGSGDVYTYSLANFTEIGRLSCQYSILEVMQGAQSIGSVSTSRGELPCKPCNMKMTIEGIDYELHA